MSSTTETKTTKKRYSLEPQPVMITKTPPGYSSRMSVGPSRMTVRRTVMSSGMVPSRGQGEGAKISMEAVQTVKSTRDKERDEMNHCNMKLADILMKTRYTETQVNTLTEECERLRKLKGYNSIPEIEAYKEEIEELRNANAKYREGLQPLKAECEGLKDRLEALQLECNDHIKDKRELFANIEKLGNENGELQGECAQLRNRCDGLLKENDTWKGDIQRLRDDIERVQGDCNEATRQQIAACEEANDLREELEFLKDVYESENCELKELLKNLKSTIPDQKTWGNEFKELVKLMQMEYDAKIDKMRDEYARRYEEQVASLQRGTARDATDSTIHKSENKTLKSQLTDHKSQLNNLKARIQDLEAQLDREKCGREEDEAECRAEKERLNMEICNLREELEEVCKSLEDIRSDKLSLEMEIMTYRKLLDGEETNLKNFMEKQGQFQSKGGQALAGIISGGGSMSGGGGSSSGGGGYSAGSGFSAGSGGGSMSQQSTMSSESTGRVQIKRSSKIAVNIEKAELDGSKCDIRNGHNTKEFDLEDWVLKRTHPKGVSVFTFPKGCKLKPRECMTIFANNWDDDYEKMKKEGSCVFLAPRDTCKTWGNGDGTFLLCDPKDVEKATTDIRYTNF